MFYCPFHLLCPYILSFFCPFILFFFCPFILSFYRPFFFSSFLYFLLLFILYFVLLFILSFILSFFLLPLLFRPSALMFVWLFVCLFVCLFVLSFYLSYFFLSFFSSFSLFSRGLATMRGFVGQSVGPYIRHWSVRLSVTTSRKVGKRTFSKLFVYVSPFQEMVLGICTTNLEVYDSCF